jgi:hypothetical protein
MVLQNSDLDYLAATSRLFLWVILFFGEVIADFMAPLAT